MLCASLLLMACSKKAEETTNGADSTEVVKEEVKAKADVKNDTLSAEEMEALNGNESEWDAVTKWEVTITAVCSLSGVVDEATAKEIQADESDDRMVEYDEEEDQWVTNGTAEIPVNNVVVTNPKHVKMLNKMMGDPKYSEYCSSVKISGTTAYAEWYGGNRGGGIADDFPAEVNRFLGME